MDKARYVWKRAGKWSGRAPLLLVVAVLGLMLVGCGSEGSGADLYASECARCHGTDRAGIRGLGPDLRTSSLALQETDDWLANRIRQGFAVMPGFARTLDENQIATIIAYLRGGSEPIATTAVPSDVLALGKRIFDVEAGGRGCASCHGLDGKGTADGPKIIGVSKSSIASALNGGVPEMGFIKLTPDELEAVYRYIVSLSENQ